MSAHKSVIERMGLSESLCNENTECQWRNGSCPIAKGSFSFLLLVRWRQQQIVYNHGEDALLTRSMVVVVVVVNCQHGYVAFCTVMSFTKETATTAGVKHYTCLQSSDDKSDSNLVSGHPFLFLWTLNLFIGLDIKSLLQLLQLSPPCRFLPQLCVIRRLKDLFFFF